MSAGFRSVLVIADCAARFDAAVRSGVELARVLELGLGGLFVEEEALLDFSALPFARVVRFGQVGLRSLDPASMRQAMEREGRRLRAELARQAEQFDLEWRFEIGRGRHGEAIQRAEGDIVVLPIALSHAAFDARLEIARALLGQGRAVLLAPERAQPRGDAVLALVAGDARRASIDLASRMAERLKLRLVVSSWPDIAGEATPDPRRIAPLTQTRAEFEPLSPGRDPPSAPPELDMRNTRLIVGRLSAIERSGVLAHRAAFARRGANLLLLP